MALRHPTALIVTVGPLLGDLLLTLRIRVSPSGSPSAHIIADSGVTQQTIEVLLRDHHMEASRPRTHVCDSTAVKPRSVGNDWPGDPDQVAHDVPTKT